MAPVAVRPELQLLFACARLAPDQERIRSIASQEIGWHKLAIAAEFHGVAPLLVRNLRAATIPIPSSVATELERWNAATGRQNLFLTSELMRVHASLKERGIEAVPLKGAVVASKLYGDLGLRPFSDIDLLIKREEVSQAEASIRELGYWPEFSIRPELRDRWLKQQCELTFRRAGAGRLELHWDIAQPHFALHTGVEGFWSRLASEQVGDVTLPGLAPNDLLFTLIVHGTRHAWSRMMWLVDLAEMLRRDPEIDWKDFWRNADSRGAARMMATGLALVRKAFGVTLPDVLAEKPGDDALASALADQVIAHWNGSTRSGFEGRELTPLWRHRWIINTRENRATRWAYARGVMTMVGEEEFAAAPLPPMFAPFYFLVRLWNILRKSLPGGRRASIPSNR